MQFLMIEASPLWELQYTGIANVVKELVNRFLDERRFQVQFSVMAKIIPKDFVRIAVNASSGRIIRDLMQSPNNLADSNLGIKEYPGRTACLYTNVRPAKRCFAVEGQVFYDFSPVIVPEFHTADTIKYHTHELIQQVACCDRTFCISKSTAMELKWIFDVPDKKYGLRTWATTLTGR